MHCPVDYMGEATCTSRHRAESFHNFRTLLLYLYCLNVLAERVCAGPLDGLCARQRVIEFALV